MDPNGDGDLSDHLDVINMSLGSSYGRPTTPRPSRATTPTRRRDRRRLGRQQRRHLLHQRLPGLCNARTGPPTPRYDSTYRPSWTASPGCAGTYVSWPLVELPLAASNPTRTGNVQYPATNQFGCSAWTGADLTNISGKVMLVDRAPPAPTPSRAARPGAANNAYVAGAMGVIMADVDDVPGHRDRWRCDRSGRVHNVHRRQHLKSQLRLGVVAPALNITLSTTHHQRSKRQRGRIDSGLEFIEPGRRPRQRAEAGHLARRVRAIWSVDGGTGNARQEPERDVDGVAAHGGRHGAAPPGPSRHGRSRS